MYFAVINCWKARHWICPIRLFVFNIRIRKVTVTVSSWTSVWWGTDRFIRNGFRRENVCRTRHWWWSGTYSVINCVPDRKRNGNWQSRHRRDRLLMPKCWRRCMMPHLIKSGTAGRISGFTTSNCFLIPIGWTDMLEITPTIIGGIVSLSKYLQCCMTDSLCSLI